MNIFQDLSEFPLHFTCVRNPLGKFFSGPPDIPPHPSPPSRPVPNWELGGPTPPCQVLAGGLETTICMGTLLRRQPVAVSPVSLIFFTFRTNSVTCCQNLGPYLYNFRPIFFNSCHFFGQNWFHFVKKKLCSMTAGKEKENHGTKGAKKNRASFWFIKKEYQVIRSRGPSK